MRALVKRLAGRGLAVLLSSHDMDEIEEICDNVIVMSRGAVEFHGTIAHLRALVPTRTPLESLSFMLTDDPNHQTLARPDARP